MNESKTCTLCREMLPPSAFHRDRQKLDGLTARCRSCRAHDRREATPHAIRKRPNSRRDGEGKVCPRCETYRSWGAFNALKSGRDGHQTYCRSCESDMQRTAAEHQKVARAARYAEKLARYANEKTTKLCRKCGLAKPQLEFYAHRGTKDGRANYCRACSREDARRRRAGRLEEIRRDSARRHADPAFRARAARQQKRMWLLKYGLTPEDYDRILAEQGGACAICRTPGKTFEDRNLSVDHDHETGLVRGLLCGACNWGLGHFKDDVSRLRNAMQYLSHSPAQKVLTN